MCRTDQHSNPHWSAPGWKELRRYSSAPVHTGTCSTGRHVAERVQTARWPQLSGHLPYDLTAGLPRRHDSAHSEQQAVQELLENNQLYIKGDTHTSPGERHALL